MVQQVYDPRQDVSYRCTRLTRSCPSVAGRGALFYPLLPKKILLNEEMDSIAKVEAVLAKWRLGVLRLREARYRDCTASRGWYLSNCLPALGRWTAQSSQSAAYCMRSHVCPWCWVRSRCHGVYRTIEQAMRRLDLPLTGKDTHKKHALLLYRESQLVDISGFGEEHLPIYLASLQRLATNSLSYLWQLRIKPFGGLGDAACLSIEPGPAGPVIQVSERHLALVPADYPVGNERSMRLYRPTKVQLGRALARFAEYPSGLLYWQAGLAAEILNAKGRSHLLVTLGQFRPDPRRRECEEPT